jgi:hypothetical protein
MPSHRLHLPLPPKRGGAALQAGKEFVYVRIEDPVDPFPLPK